MLADGRAGRPHLIRGAYLQDWLLEETDWNWRLQSERSGASRALGDIGSHWIDLVQHVTGRRSHASMPASAACTTSGGGPAGDVRTFDRGGEANTEPVAVDTEDFANVLFEMDDGCAGRLHGLTGVAGETERARVRDRHSGRLARMGPGASERALDRAARPGERAARARPGPPLGRRGGAGALPGRSRGGMAGRAQEPAARLLRVGSRPRARRAPRNQRRLIRGRPRITCTIEALLESHRTGSWIAVDPTRTMADEREDDALSPARMRELEQAARDVAADWGVELGPPYRLARYSYVAPAGPGCRPEDHPRRGRRVRPRGRRSRALGRRRRRPPPAARPGPPGPPDGARRSRDRHLGAPRRRGDDGRDRAGRPPVAARRGALPVDRRPRPGLARPGGARRRRADTARAGALCDARRRACDPRARRLPPPQHPAARRGDTSRSTPRRCSASRSSTCRASSGTRSSRR